MNEASPRSWISSLSSGQRAALLAALFTLIALGVLAFLAKGTSELPVYTRAAERMALGQEIYRPAEPKPFTYPPFLALPFVPLTLLPGSAHRPLWFLVNLGALVWILRLLARRLRPIFTREPRAKRAWLFGLLVFLLAARHVLSVFENQSNDLLVFLAVALAVDSACRARHLETGIWAGVGTALKATPVLFGPVLLWQRRFAAAAVLGLVTLALTLSPDWILPRSEGGSWVVSWYESFLGGIRPGEPASAAGAWAPWNKLNQNLASTIYRLTTAVSSSGRHLFDVSILNLDASTRRWLTLAAQLAILGLLLRVTRPSLTRDLPSEELSLRRLGEGSAILTSMVLLSPMSSKSHFCVLLFPVAFCLADLLYRRLDVILLLLLSLVFALGTLTSKGLLGARLGDQFLARGSVTLCALALLAATGHVLCRRSRAHRARQPGVQA